MPLHNEKSELKSFLQNQHAAELADELALWLGEGSPQNYRCFVIADMTMLNPKMLARLERHTSAGVQILETSRYAAYEELGPRLIPLDRRGGPAQLDRNLVFLSEFSAG